MSFNWRPFHCGCRCQVICVRACFRFLWPCIVSKVWREKNQQDATIRCFIINFCLNMFRASLCPSSGEQRPCYCIWCVVLVLLMWLVAVVGCCLAGCEQCSHPTGSASMDALPWSHYLPTGLDNLPCSHGTYQHEAITSRSRQLLMMGTWLPETCWATIRREIENTKSDI